MMSILELRMVLLLSPRGFEPRCTLTENYASQVNLCNAYGHLFRDGSYTRESGKGRGSCKDYIW